MKNLKKLISVDLSIQHSKKNISNWRFYILYFIFFLIFYFGIPALFIWYLVVELLMNDNLFLVNLKNKIWNLVGLFFLTFATFYISMSVMFIDLRISPWRLRFGKNQTKIKPKQQSVFKSFLAIFKNSFSATMLLLAKFLVFVISVLMCIFVIISLSIIR